MENRAEHLLETYFANALTAAEATELHQLISGDPALAAEMAFQKKLSSSLQSAILENGIQHSAWRTAALKPFSQAPVLTVTRWPKYVMAMAAALALLVVAYLFITPPGLSTVVADNAKEYPNKMRFKSLGNEAEAVPEQVIQAFKAYDQAKYEGAALALQTIVSDNPDRMDYRFYWGVSLVKSKNYSEAVKALSPLVEGTDEWRVPAMYYLGLACAGSGDKNCARTQLQAYIDSPEGVTYRKEAKVVIDAL